MKENKNNNSSLVKEYILTALILLSKEKSLSSISISELCTRAGVSRMSFYRNYSSIDDIITKQLNALFDEYVTAEDQLTRRLLSPTKEIHIVHYFDYLYSHKDFLDMLIAYGIDSIFLTKQTEYLQNLYSDPQKLYTMVAFAGAIYNVFRLWSASNYTLNKEELISSVTDIYLQ